MKGWVVGVALDDGQRRQLAAWKGWTPLELERALAAFSAVELPADGARLVREQKLQVLPMPFVLVLHRWFAVGLGLLVLAPVALAVRLSVGPLVLSLLVMGLVSTSFGYLTWAREQAELAREREGLDSGCRERLRQAARTGGDVAGCFEGLFSSRPGA